MVISLGEHVESRVPLAAGDRHWLDALPRRILRRREVLCRPGDRSTPLVYVESGLLRLSGTDANARERTFQFALEGWWMADWEGFSGAAEFTLQAVEDTRLVALDRRSYEGLLADLPALEGYFRRVYERAWAAAQRRLMIHETAGAEAMYRAFVDRYPEFVQRVPQYMLASFLGFSPEFLSRIRSRRS